MELDPEAPPLVPPLAPPLAPFTQSSTPLEHAAAEWVAFSGFDSFPGHARPLTIRRTAPFNQIVPEDFPQSDEQNVMRHFHFWKTSHAIQNGRY